MKKTSTAKSTPRRILPRVAGFRLLRGKQVAYFPDTHKRITIGRTNKRDIRVRHRTVSRMHAVVERTTDGHYAISDPGAKNGIQVSVRGHWSRFLRVEWRILEVGHYVRLGNVILVAVDAHGECPITVHSADEIAEYGMELYGSKSRVLELFKIPRRLLEHCMRAIRERATK